MSPACIPSMNKTSSFYIFSTVQSFLSRENNSLIMKDATKSCIDHIKSCDERVSWARNQRDAALAKVEPRLEGIPDELPVNSQSLPKAVLTKREIEITEKYSVKQLLSKLWDRSFSVEEVTRAFLRRAALAQVAVSLDLIREEEKKKKKKKKKNIVLTV